MPPPSLSVIKASALRLQPGDDLKDALDAWARNQGVSAACVIGCVGSLSQLALRFADRPTAGRRRGKFEIVSLEGTLSGDGSHLHLAVADARGRVCGGHVKAGCVVHTTAEIVLALLPGLRFARHPDAATGYRELLISRARKPRGATSKP